MQDNIIKKIIFYVLLQIVFCSQMLVLKNTKVVEAANTGTKSNPYEVASFSELESVLETKKGTSDSPYYVAITANIYVSSEVTVPSGGFFVLQTSENSGGTKNIIRKADFSGYCFHISKGGGLVFGNGESSYNLNLRGNKDNVSKAKAFIYNQGTCEFAGNINLYNNRNNVNSCGGGIYNNSGTFTMTAGSIYNNEVVYKKGNVDDGLGGGIFSWGKGAKVIVNGGSIGKNGYGNIANANGGGIAICGGTIEINGGKIFYNTSGTEGGGVYIGLSDSDSNTATAVTVTMNGGNIAYNVSEEEGGGIFLQGTVAKGYIYSGSIYCNKSSLSGGGISSVYGATLVVGSTDETVTEPKIYSNESETIGGGIRCNGGISTNENKGGKTKFNAGKIYSNVAAQNGGGISVGSGEVAGSYLQISGLEIYENIAGGNGGGISIGGDVYKNTANSTVSISDCSIYGNTADKGGGIHSKSDFILLSGNIGDTSYAKGNVATQNGGGIYLDKCSMKITGTEKVTIKNNKSSGHGGGIYIPADSSLYMANENAYITTNYTISSGGDGAGIYNCGKITLYGGNIQYNHAARNGGGIKNTGTGEINCMGVVIKNNEAGTIDSSNGGGIHNAGTLNFKNYSGNDSLNGEIRILNNYITNGNKGAGIYNTSSDTSKLILDSSKLFIYSNGNDKNGGYGISNSGTMEIKSSAKIGFSYYSSASDYSGKTNYSGGINNIGTLYVYGKNSKASMARIYEEGGDGVTNSGTLIIEEGSSFGIFTVNGTGITNTGIIESNASSTYANFIYGCGNYGIVNNNSGSISWAGNIYGNYNVTDSGIVAGNENNLYYGIYNTAKDNGKAALKILAGTTRNCTCGVYDNNSKGTTEVYGGTITRCEKAIYHRQGNLEYISGNITNNSSSSGCSGISVGVYGSTTVSSNASAHIYDCNVENNYSAGSGGGIVVRSMAALYIEGGKISQNNTASNGGGIYLEENSYLYQTDGTISDNTATLKGQGIFDAGNYYISKNASVDVSNDVFLKSETYVFIKGKLNKQSGYVCVFTPENYKLGRIMAKVCYDSECACEELYYSGTKEDEENIHMIEESIKKKFMVNDKGQYTILRPGDNVNECDEHNIILSEKYEINYYTNCNDDVKNMPENQIKFFEENMILSSSLPERAGYNFNLKYSFNTKETGDGVVYSPGSVNKENSNLDLYAIWDSGKTINITIDAPDRYYFVGQDIELDKEEILKKIKVHDSIDDTEYSLGDKYDICVTDVTLLATVSNSGEGTENLVCFQAGDKTKALPDKKYKDIFNVNEEKVYKVTVRTDTADKDKEAGYEDTYATEEMYVYVQDSTEIPLVVRFISDEYLWTLKEDSLWAEDVNPDLYNVLKESMKNDTAIMTVTMTSDDVKQAKEYIKDTDYSFEKSENVNFAKMYIE